MWAAHPAGCNHCSCRRGARARTVLPSRFATRPGLPGGNSVQGPPGGTSVQNERQRIIHSPPRPVTGHTNVELAKDYDDLPMDEVYTGLEGEQGNDEMNLPICPTNALSSPGAPGAPACDSDARDRDAQVARTQPGVGPVLALATAGSRSRPAENTPSDANAPELESPSKRPKLPQGTRAASFMQAVLPLGRGFSPLVAPESELQVAPAVAQLLPCNALHQYDALRLQLMADPPIDRVACTTNAAVLAYRTHTNDQTAQVLPAEWFTTAAGNNLSNNAALGRVIEKLVAQTRESLAQGDAQGGVCIGPLNKGKCRYSYGVHNQAGRGSVYLWNAAGLRARAAVIVSMSGAQL